MIIKELIQLIETNKEFEEFKPLLNNLKKEDPNRPVTEVLKCLSDFEIRAMEYNEKNMWKLVKPHLLYCNDCCAIAVKIKEKLRHKSDCNCTNCLCIKQKATELAKEQGCDCSNCVAYFIEDLIYNEN